MSLETTRERKEKGGERGEKKKGLLALIIFILPTLEIVSERQKSARDTPLGHLNRAVPFSKIRVYIYIYIYIYIYLQSWIIWSKTFIATQSFMLLAKQSSGNCQK